MRPNLEDLKLKNVDTTVTHISLCSGYGGIDLGLKRVCPGLRTVAYAEIEAFACELLLARMEGGQLDAAPIWSDLKSFPWAKFSGKVDILTGGYPCQPFSAAGKRAGKDDPRHLWPWIADGIAAMRPKLCFFENVEGHISLGLSDVIEDLAGMGYRTTWGIFSAAECGAPHQRKRVFIMAHRNGEGLERYDQLLTGFHQSRWESPESQGQIDGSNCCGVSLANANSNGGGKGRLIRQGADGAEPVSNGKSWGAWPSRPGQQQHAWEPPRVVGNAESGNGQRSAQGQARHFAQPDQGMGNANGSRPQERQGQGGSGLQGADSDGGEDASRQAQPTLGGDVDGAACGLDHADLSVSCDSRVDELRLLGNGVVPATAALAFQTLWHELSKD